MSQEANFCVCVCACVCMRVVYVCVCGVVCLCVSMFVCMLSTVSVIEFFSSSVAPMEPASRTGCG